MAKLGPLKSAVTIREGKQREILGLIIKGNPDGSFADIDQVMSRLSYDTTKASFQFSLRCLERKKLTEREEELRYRDGAKRRVLKPTMLGYTLFKTL